MPVQKQKRGNKQCRALPSPSPTRSTREDVSRDHFVQAIAYLPEQCCLTKLSENNTEKLTNDTSCESHLGKTHGAPFGIVAGHKRKHEKELAHADIESHKRPQKTEPAVTSFNSSEDNSLSKKQKVQSEETVPKTNVAVVDIGEKPAEKFRVQETEQKEKHNPISYWAVHHTWPENFAEYNAMASSNNTNKRQRTSVSSEYGNNERSVSYTRSRKRGEVPEQYTAAYEEYILTKGLDMGDLRGEECVSKKSEKLCVDLQKITYKTIKPIIFPNTTIRKVIELCRNRNEAIVNRDITPMIIPPISSLYFAGESNLEHVVDEVNADWYSQCVLAGPQLRPDLAIGLFASAFTKEEIDKMKRYTSVDNWTQVTTQMFFPFLMCEVKCGGVGLDIADRQNMHSCSVAVRALLRIEQEADKYRLKKGIEKKTDSLNGQVLVFSISHDQKDARLYGHYAIVQWEKWAYYRYPIQKFDLAKKASLLAIHNSVRNILKSHLPEHVRRLKDALAALPDPNKPLESSSLPGSSGLSFTTSGISLNDKNSQQDSQNRDPQGFLMPPRPESSRNGGAKKKGRENAALQSQLDKSMQQQDKLMQHLDKLTQQQDKLMQQLEEKEGENRKLRGETETGA